MSKVLKIGVVVDNYKVKKFVKALDDAGYDCKQSKFTKDTTTITFRAGDHAVPELKKLFQKLEIDVKLSN